MALLLTLAGTASALPGAELAPIRGMAYQPAPSDYTGNGAGVYFDSDFFNDDFKQLWSTADGGRGDLHTMATQLNVNLLHLYDWNPARNHLGFMNEALANGIRIALPISNFFVGNDPNAEADIEKIVREVYVDAAGNPSTVPHPAVVMWTIANEFDLSSISAAQVAQATAFVVAAEQKIGATRVLPVSVPVSFGTFGGDPGVVKTLEAINALKANPALGDAFVSSRFVAATNPQNPGSFIEQWLPKFKQQVPNTMLWFSELGTAVQNSCNGYPAPCTPDEQQQAVFNADEWKASQPGAEGILLGGAQFEFLNEPWKGGTEATFGVYKFATPNNFRVVPTAGGTYRVDQLVRKPSWFSLQTAFGGSGSVGVGSSLGGFLGAFGPAAAVVAAVGGSGLCSPLLSACTLALDKPPPPVAPPASSEAEDDGSAVGGAPRMPNLRAKASARWVDGSVRVRVRVVATHARLVRRGFLVRVSIPSLGERKDVTVRLHGDRARTTLIRLDVPARAIGRRVIVEVDPTDRVLEARERDNGARARVR